MLNVKDVVQELNMQLLKVHIVEDTINHPFSPQILVVMIDRIFYDMNLEQLHV
jgi:hypothetical protein